ncbi:MAG: permease-like cell division protein FtsX [Melioribacter sp.]|nr:permease-like cell division protein FtsX [Melioribacter sp.]
MMFYLKETFRIFRRSSIASIVTITITTIAVFLTSLSIFMIFISRDFSDRIKQNIEINLYLKDSLNKNDIERTQTLIEEKSYVSSAKFVSKENAAKDFIRETGEDFRSVLDYNPLPNSFAFNFNAGSVSEKNFEVLVSDLKSIPGVSDVVYDFNVVVRILKILRSLEVAIYIASLLLILLSVYLVYSNNRVQYENNKNLYNTMKLVGAKISAIKIPIYIYSILIGLFSSIICFVINYVILKLLTAININIKFSFDFGVIHIITFIIGLSLGFLGSYFASMKITLNISENVNISR